MAPVRLTVLTFCDITIRTKDNDADIVAFKIQGHATHAILELDRFAWLERYLAHKRAAMPSPTEST